MNKMQSFNIHSHTYRCGHASGTDEEYVLGAIKAGFEIMGFADHVILPNAAQIGMRGNPYELDGYLQSIGELQEKYKEKIKIYKGFEAEWYGEEYASYYRDLLASGKVDYLILGQHCFRDFGHFYWYASYRNADEGRRHYARDLIAGMRSGLFTYVCHPDLYVAWGGRFDRVALEIAEEICKTALEMDMPLEVNMGPSLYSGGGRPNFEYLSYPNSRFWDVVARYGCKVVFGVDAHDPRDYQHADYEAFKAFAEEKKLNLISTCPVKK